MATKLWVGTDSGNEGDLNVAANWSPSGVPSGGDDVVFRDSDQDADTSLDALSAVELGTLMIHQSFEGYLGSATAYLETICPDLVEIGVHSGEGNPVGSDRIKLDLTGASSAGTIIVHDSSTQGVNSAAEQYLPPVRLKTPAAAVHLEVRKGRVGVALGAGETATLGTLRMLYSDRGDRETGARVYLGNGVTLSTVEKHGGLLEMDLDNAATTILQTAGQLLLNGTAALTTLSAHGGRVVCNLEGTITNVEAYGAVIDAMQSQVARTWTNLKIRDRGEVAWDPDIVTITNVLPQEAIRLQHSSV